jgi:plastocyanin
MLALAVTVAAPALSAAQDDAAPVTPPPPPAAPASPVPPVPPDPPAAPAEATDQQVQVQSQPAPAPAVADPSAPTEKSKTAKTAASKTVSVGDNFYSPATVTINVGDTVTWTNNGAAPHSATADDGSFDTGVFTGGQSRSETFTTAGDVPYFCTVHGQAQSGTIKVLAASGGGGSGGGGGADATTGSSEAAAVASSGAAGSSTSLPATGFLAVGLFAVGFALVGGGSYLKRLERRLTSSA